MKEMKETTERKTTKSATLPLGVNLEVSGRAIIAQADERIQWHKRSAARIETELKAMSVRPDARYLLALSDMSLLEIMPKGRYW